MSTSICCSPQRIVGGDVEAVVEAVEQVPTHQLPVVFVSEENEERLTELAAELDTLDRPFVGALVPGVIFESSLSYEDVIVLGIAGEPYLIEGLGEGEYSLDSLPDPAELGGGTFLLLVDGLCRHTGSFLRSFYARYGTGPLYCGTGVGSLKSGPGPCLIAPGRVVGGAAIAIHIPQSVTLGVGHGFERVMGPVIATDVDGNAIQQLNWRPAFDVYREAIEPALGEKLSIENLMERSRRYTFGLERTGDEDVVRDLIATREDGALIAVVDIPSNAILHILEGKPDRLIAAAEEAAVACSHDGDTPQQHLLFDCLTRVELLGDRFNAEAAAVRRGVGAENSPRPLVGVLSVGEISSIGDRYLEFLNKTAVVVSIPVGSDDE